SAGPRPRRAADVRLHQPDRPAGPADGGRGAALRGDRRPPGDHGPVHRGAGRGGAAAAVHVAAPHDPPGPAPRASAPGPPAGGPPPRARPPAFMIMGVPTMAATCALRNTERGMINR